MKFILFFIFSYLSILNPLFSQTFTEWKTISVPSVNTVLPHTEVYSYSDEKEVLKKEFRYSDLFQTLHGNWKYYPVDDISKINSSFIEKKQYQTKDFSDVILPGIDSFRYNSSIPEALYENRAYSSEFLEKHNTAGVYTTEFDVPKYWKEYCILLNLEFSHAAYYVYVNDHFVGYSALLKSDTDFDISPFIKVGKTNTLSLVVFRLSSNSYIDFYDNLYAGGIMQEAFIYAKPLVHIADYSLNASLNKSYTNGILDAEVVVNNFDKKSGYYVELELLDAQGKSVERYFQLVQIQKNESKKIHFLKEINEPQIWSSENPYLYTLLVRIKDLNTQIIELTGQKIGFRKVELNQGKLLINGKKILLKGIHYRQNVEPNGVYWSEKSMKNDIELMKQHNINAVFTKNGPLSPRFYELCDQYGLYVINSANICIKHPSVLKNPEWGKAVVEQVENMYEHSKNHPSVIIWSLGSSIDNENCFDKAYKWLKQKDDRPIFFEASEGVFNTDIVSLKNYTLSALTDYTNQKASKPLLLHKMGDPYTNDLGSLSDFYNMAMRFSVVSGIFIDEFRGKGGFFDRVDHEKGSGIAPHAVVEKGLVTSSTLLPPMQEMKNVFKPFKILVQDIEQGDFQIANLFHFQPLNSYRLNYTVFSNFKGSGIIEGEVPLNLQAGERTNFKIRIPEVTTYGSEEYFIRFTLVQKENSPAFPEGTELGFEDFKIKTPHQEKQTMPDYEYGKLDIKDQDPFLEIQNHEVRFIFNKREGTFTDLQLNGHSFFKSPPTVRLFRLPTFNEKLLPSKSDSTQLSFVVKDIKYNQENDHTFFITFIYDIVDPLHQTKLADLSQTYTLLGSGDMLLDNQLVIQDKRLNISNFGIQLYIPEWFESAEWFGNQSETYADRKTGSKIGVWKYPIHTLCTLYPMAQENGNRSLNRWLSLTGENRGLFIDLVDTLFDFSISPFSDKSIDSTLFTNQLDEEDFWVLNIDYKKEGIGIGSLTAEVSPSYQLTESKYHFMLRFKPYQVDKNNPESFRLNGLPILKNEVLPMPLINKDRDKFDTTMFITITSPIPHAQIRYTLDNSDPNESSLLYSTPIPIHSTTTVKARLYAEGKSPSFSAREVFKFDYISYITFTNQPNTPYNKNKETLLFDAYKGNVDFKEDNWLGFSGNDFSADLELKTPIHLYQLKATFGHDPESWTFLPENFSISVSEDGITYSESISGQVPFNPTLESENTKQIETLTITTDHKNIKYIKIRAGNIKKIPNWHLGKGLNAWILISEIEVMDYPEY